MPLQFTKMHGLGNDYVYISTFDQRVDDAPRLARRISDRHRGVGSDGLILIAPPTAAAAQVRMIMYNVDGSRGQMCGNGIRCVAKYAFDHGLARSNPLRVETDRGVLDLALTTGADGLVREVRVDMGEPILEPAAMPTTLSGDRIVRRRLDIAEFDLPVTCISMGNPHAIFFHPDVSRIPLQHWGPLVERHPVFPERTNVHFAQVLAPHRVKMVTWERGSGPTLACGTGASAVCVAGVLNGLTASAIIAELPGGELRVEWDRATNHVFMSGPAEEVFSGTWPG
jgi:diaminopimelate epimerase